MNEATERAPQRAGSHRLANALVLGMLLASSPARAETPSVRVGELSLKPYVLLQLDEGGTFNQSRRGGQGSYGKQFEYDLIYNLGSTAGGNSRFFEADIAYVGLAPFVVRAGIYKWSFTLEYSQSAADLLFLERASIVNVLGGLVAWAGRVGGKSRLEANAGSRRRSGPAAGPGWAPTATSARCWGASPGWQSRPATWRSTSARRVLGSTSRRATRRAGAPSASPIRRSCRSTAIPHDPALYRQRHLIENMFGKLKDWRRIHTRYDRCAHTFMSAISIAAIIF